MDTTARERHMCGCGSNSSYVIVSLITVCVFFCFFFFQAEDGIRDYKVTGVQTCALPICIGSYGDFRASDLERELGIIDVNISASVPTSTCPAWWNAIQAPS